MKTLMTAIVIALTAGAALATPMYLDATDPNEVFIVADEALVIAGYEITSASGSLGNGGWTSLNSQAMTLMGSYPGMTAGLFGLAPIGSAGSLAEVGLNDIPVPAGFTASLGNIFPNGIGDAAFFYAETVGGSTSMVQGDIVPEPATMSLLALGGLVAARRRR